MQPSRAQHLAFNPNGSVLSRAWQPTLLEEEGEYMITEKIREGSEMISSHIFKARKNAAISPNLQELSLPLQNSPSKPKAVMKDTGIPKNRLKKSTLVTGNHGLL